MAGQNVFAFRRSSSSKTFAWVFGPTASICGVFFATSGSTRSAASGSNVFAAHGVKPQSSSLMKMPRYSTEGACEVLNVSGRVKESRFSGVTSAHHS